MRLLYKPDFNQLESQACLWNNNRILGKDIQQYISKNVGALIDTLNLKSLKENKLLSYKISKWPVTQVQRFSKFKILVRVWVY